MWLSLFDVAVAHQALHLHNVCIALKSQRAGRVTQRMHTYALKPGNASGTLHPRYST